MGKRKNWSWVRYVALSIFIFGVITKNPRLYLLALILLLFLALLIQLFRGRILDRWFNESTPRADNPRLYWDIVVGTIIAIILAVCGYSMLFITHTFK